MFGFGACNVHAPIIGGDVLHLHSINLDLWTIWWLWVFKVEERPSHHFVLCEVGGAISGQDVDVDSPSGLSPNNFSQHGIVASGTALGLYRHPSSHF